MTKQKSDQITKTPSAGSIHTIERNQPEVLKVFDCQICGKHWEVYRLPSRTPKYCLPEPGQDISDCQKKAVAKRVAKHRQEKRAKK